MNVRELDIALDGGGTLHAYDTGGDDRLAVLWHHGTPNIGAPPAPLFEQSERLGIRWVAYDRPGYGGSTPAPGRAVASAATCATRSPTSSASTASRSMGHSGGGPHALACAALLPDRVVAVVSAAGLAPFDAAGLDWFAGMIPSGEASLRAAAAGRAAKEAYEASGVEYDFQFTPADLATLEGPWGWLGSVVGPALASGPGGLIDDDLAYVAPWGCDPADVAAPVLLLHGGADGIVPSAHGEWLAQRLAVAELRLTPDDGHLSVLTGAPSALDWLRAQAP